MIRIESVDVETFRRHFGSGIFIALAAFCGPDIIFRIGVITSDGDFAAFGHRFFIPFNFDRRHHGLTCVSESSRRPVIEHVILVIDQLEAAMGIVSRKSCLQFGSILSGHNRAGIHKNAAAFPGPQR